MELTGIALEPHAETNGSSGIIKYWPAEELGKAADTLIGCHIYDDAGRNAENVIGQVKDAEWKDGIGVVYTAEVFDEEIGRKLEADLIELAPRMFHESIQDPNDGPTGVSDVEFDGLFACSAASDGVPGSLLVNGRIKP